LSIAQGKLDFALRGAVELDGLHARRAIDAAKRALIDVADEDVIFAGLGEEFGDGGADFPGAQE
jgi:hypothetical protein